MTRILFFILKLALLTAAAVWVASHPGSVTIQWQGLEVATSVGVLVLAVVLLVITAIALHSLYQAIVGIPGSFAFGALSRRRRKGYLALTEGMVAVAAGDAAAAKRFAHKAEKLLAEPPLTMLLQAQAAQLSGDETAAARYFSAMLDRPEMSFLGIRGLLTQAIKQGNTTEALALARRAYAQQPKADWVISALFDLEARTGDKTAALNLLTVATKQGIIDLVKSKTLRATLLLMQAGEGDDTLGSARRAHELFPAFIPAALAYAKALQAAGKQGAAAKVIERSWRVAPHPELADLYVALEAGLPPLKQVKRLERLIALNDGGVEGQLALARTSLRANLWGEARAALTKVLAAGPSAVAATLMSELEKRERHDSKAAHEWLVKAASAPAPMAWVCHSCHAAQPHWAAICPSCQALAALEWKAPRQSISLLPPMAS